MTEKANDPQVAVVMPVYNAERTVDREVRSILRQSLQQHELIVVDDGSTDATAEVVAAINDPRLKLVRQNHQGVAAAANRAIAETAASWIARMDADDFAHPRRLERQLEWIRANGADVVGCRVSIVDSAGDAVASLTRYEKWINEETATHEAITALRFVEFPLVNPTILARRDYFDLQFRDADVPEDYDLMLRGASRGMRFGKVDEVLLDWIDHEHRLTRTDTRYTTAAFDRCRRQHLIKGPLCDATAVDVWGAGQTGKRWLRWLESRKIEIRHVYDVHPRRIGRPWSETTIRAASALAPPDGTPLLIAVGAEGARQIIAPQLRSARYRPGIDAWFVA